MEESREFEARFPVRMENVREDLDRRNAEIWRLRQSGMTQVELSKKTGLNVSTIRSICNRFAAVEGDPQLKSYSRRVQDAVHFLRSKGFTVTPPEPKPKPAALPANVREWPVEELELSIRARKRIEQVGYKTIGEVADNRTQLWRIDGWGKVCDRELKRVLDSMLGPNP